MPDDTGLDHDLHRLAARAAANLRTGAGAAGHPSELAHLAFARRLTLAVSGGTVLLVAAAVAAVSTLAAPALPWVVGAALVLAVAGVVAVGVHAGGHGWFVPLPVLLLAAGWALSASAGGWSSALGWLLAALTISGAGFGALMVAPAIAARRQGAGATGAEALVGAAGVAVTGMAPTGIARVNNETWTAESISGPLPAGAPVHVARVSGLRLMVWSEAGTVPAAESLASITNDKEET
jgi:membrane-bound ClpP family serine protease